MKDNDAVRTDSAGAAGENAQQQDNPQAKIAQAVSLLRSGGLAAAEKLLTEVLDADSANTDALHFLGLVTQANKRPGLAERLLRECVERSPQNASYTFSLARFFLLEGNDLEAMRWFFKILEIKPEDIQARYQLGALLVKTGQYRAAAALMAETANIKPDDAYPYIVMGGALSKMREYDKAIAAYRKALERKPDNMEATLLLCDCLRIVGMIEQAREILEALRTMYPARAEPLVSLMETSSVEKGDPLFEQLEKCKLNHRLPRLRQSNIRFALGDAYRKIGDYEASFKNYAEAHAHKARHQDPYDLKTHVETMARLAEVFTREYFEQHKGWGLDTVKPIFIVGMARSGTSLVEQILASHPRVYGAGELQHINALVRFHLGVRGIIEPNFTKEKVEAAGKEYVRLIEQAADGEDFVSDKMPYNALHLWAIQLMFPNAHVVYCTRDALDNCFSCYVQNFETGHEFTNDLSTLGIYYRYYEKLMRHWMQALPGKILEIQYESVVERPREMMEKILAHCGLEWDERCERFYETDRSVATASRVQVRQKIYRTSVNRAKPYAIYLHALTQALEQYKNTPISQLPDIPAPDSDSAPGT